MLPLARGVTGLTLADPGLASPSLMTDLRTDAGMGWVPQSGWLSQLRIDTTAGNLTFDLAIDAAGRSPSRVAAGLEAPVATDPTPIALTTLAAAILATVTGA